MDANEIHRRLCYDQPLVGRTVRIQHQLRDAKDRPNDTYWREVVWNVDNKPLVLVDLASCKMPHGGRALLIQDVQLAPWLHDDERRKPRHAFHLVQALEAMATKEGGYTSVRLQHAYTDRVGTQLVADGGWTGPNDRDEYEVRIVPYVDTDDDTDDDDSVHALSPRSVSPGGTC